jgi:hypothetical protein
MSLLAFLALLAAAGNHPKAKENIIEKSLIYETPIKSGRTAS